MPGVTINPKVATLRTDALADLGVSIVDVNLKCNNCGFDYMLPVPWDTGNFPRNWYVCPGECNKGETRPGT